MLASPRSGATSGAGFTVGMRECISHTEARCYYQEKNERDLAGKHKLPKKDLCYRSQISTIDGVLDRHKMV